MSRFELIRVHKCRDKETRNRHIANAAGVAFGKSFFDMNMLDDDGTMSPRLVTFLVTVGTGEPDIPGCDNFVVEVS